MRKKEFVYVFIALFGFSSCSSPESDGLNVANKLNKCNTSYIENVQKAESDFIADFSRASYQTRAEAKQAYLDVMTEANSKYQQDIAEFYEQAAVVSKKYIGDYKKKAIYENALRTGVDNDLQQKVTVLSMSTEIPEPVMANVRTVIPSKPDNLQIQKDLEGRSLTEGVDDGYYPSNWTWTIKEGEISGFNIETVLSDTPQDYLLIANMRLTSEVGKSVDVKVKIRYVLPHNNDWTIEFAQSLGMYIVRTHQYDDCVRDDFQWGNHIIRNQCDLALEIGVKVLYGDHWDKYSFVIKAHDDKTIYHEEVIIDYIERP